MKRSIALAALAVLVSTSTAFAKDWPSAPGTTAKGIVIEDGAGNAVTNFIGGSPPFTIGTDQSAGLFGTYDLLTGNSVGHNSLIGTVTNGLPSSSNAFPTGVTGYAKLPTGTLGNTAFGSFSFGTIAATGGGTILGAEDTVQNNSGNAPDLNQPPNTAIGTTTTNAIGRNITCSVSGTNDCSSGLRIGNETLNYADHAFTDGISIEVFRRDGIYIKTLNAANRAIYAWGTDTGTVAVLGGATKAVRFGADTTKSLIEGVDNTGTGSYQPLFVGGSTLDLTIGGVSKAQIDATGKFTIVGTLTAAALTGAANCSGQPSGNIIAITGTGVLTKCP